MQKLSLPLPPVTAYELINNSGGASTWGEYQNTYAGRKAYCLARRPALYFKAEPEILPEAGFLITVSDGTYEATVYLMHQEYVGWHIISSPLRYTATGQVSALKVGSGPHTHVFTPYSLLHPTVPDGWTVWGEMVDQELLAHRILHVDVTDNMVGVFRSLPTVIEMFSVPLDEIALFVFDIGQNDGSAPLTPEEVTTELLHPSPCTAAALNGCTFTV